MNEPKSIFTHPSSLGNTGSSNSIPTNLSSRRLSTPDYEKPPSAGLEPNQHPLVIPPVDPERTQWSSRSSTERPLLNARNIALSQTSFAVAAYLKTPGVASKKRTASAIDHSTIPQPNSEPLRKRRRLHTQHRHTLDQFSFPLATLDFAEPPSPLFFSNSKRTRPALPARFSSSEAAARMLSRTRDEDGGIKTVTLARGTFSASSPPIGNIAPGGRGSVERTISAPGTSSPDAKEKGDSLRILGQVGIIELLEQDGRPTFIVDLGDTSNYGPGPLHIVFANTCLRAHPEMLELVTGKSNGESAASTLPTGYEPFKAWVLSAAMQGESLDVCLPSFMHGGMSWSCSTLRKRLRIVSASSTLPTKPILNSQVTSSDISMCPPSGTGSSIAAQGSTNSGSVQEVVPTTEEEPQDYFGNAAPPKSSTGEAGNLHKSATESPDPKKTTEMGLNGSVFSKHSDVSSSLDTHPSLTNECVLRAAAAGNADSFGHIDSLYSTSDSPKEVGFFDWTRLPLTASLPRHIQFARSVDWASTPLGPIEFWSSDLRQMCNLIMASPHPAAMYWGDDLVAIYNEAYVLLAGQKHPKLMGQSYKDAWVEIWDDVKDVFANAKSTGQATMKDDDCLFMKRNDYLEETYFSWSIIPMVGGDGTVMGLYNPAFEKTRRKIAERRMLTLREVGERTATARDVKSFWEEVCGALETNEYDTPFVLLYSVSDESDSDASSIHSMSLMGSKLCYLEGSLGVPKGHPSAPEQIELKTGMEGFGPVFREVMKTDRPVLLEIGSGDLPAEMMEGMQWRGFGDPCKAVVVCPVHPTTGESTLGFLVMGVNPRRPYDDDYSLFVQLLSRQLATSLASVVLFEEEIRRGQRAAKLAALDRIELSEQLAARTQEARDSETRFTRMAEFSPAGLFIADSEGHITYCNDTWYEISRVPKDPSSTDRWINSVKEEDQALVRNLWNELVEHTKPVTAEFRFKASWEDRNGNRTDTWVLFSAYPEKDEQGMLKSVFGTMTNISQQKWAEGFQRRRMEEAVELKRQQENFIDITSHEMRNPLSAILQCADEISSSLSEYRASKPEKIDYDVVNDAIDAAQTIALCAQHQKRIVDDVLTLSKLDSAMLLVTPVDVQPLAVVQRALKMFEAELQTADIQMKFVVDDSFKNLGIDWVRIDPSRVLQVLINLTTNAIKFTTTQSKRTIVVTLSASLESPSTSGNCPVDYFPTRSKRKDMMQGPDWGNGEEVYLHFAVQDTGRGLTVEEKKLLFLRFSQASPRTHVQYGGSGLGLFISRELTELQGGEIGVASEAGKGSTFAFYVKARRSNAPKDPAEQLPVALCPKPSDLHNNVKVNTPPKTRDFATAAAPPTPALTPTAKPEKRSRSDLKVLVVEDNLVNQRVLMKQLRNLGFVVHVANHGGEALEKLRGSRFWYERNANAIDLSVVLMDQEMPVMDGLQCTRRIREWEQSGRLVRHVPIVGVTANARAEQISALLAAGMDDVVSKPFRIPDLVPKIEELAAKYPEESRPTVLPTA